MTLKNLTRRRDLAGLQLLAVPCVDGPCSLGEHRRMRLLPPLLRNSSSTRATLPGYDGDLPLPLDDGSPPCAVLRAVSGRPKTMRSVATHVFYRLHRHP